MSMESGFVLGGQPELAERLWVQNFLDNPKLHLAPDDQRARSESERRWIRAIVLHTTGGIPGGKNLTEQVIHPGFGPSSRAGERIVGDWTHDHARPGGAHLIIDFDGRVYCCADLLATAAYHAETANGSSVGIEIAQGKDASLYDGQLDVAVAVVDWLTERLGIQRQFHGPYQGGAVGRLTGILIDTGVFGHRDLTNKRGKGDPGDAVFAKLQAAGYECFDFSHGEDLDSWRHRQFDMGMLHVDGIPGPGTRAALFKAGHPSGMWVSR
jgi:hypothetical protein